MLVSSRLLPTVGTMHMYDNNTIRSYQSTTPSSLIPSTSLPKYFNVPFAIQHGYFRCVRYLLELDYDPNERDVQLRTPLILCAYIDNDRWSSSLAQNLLEKGAKIALEDHARRNAMHHACALQRLHLVQSYLSCLDFNLEAKDCEGNTCLHYAAITGNCEIAELLMRTADKHGIHLDQCINREGCSAAILALKYGHIECANQITHRDWDEFFVVPRPLSIYETPSTTDDNRTVSTSTTHTKRRKKFSANPPSSLSSQMKSPIRPSTLSFNLLKIMFNDSDTSFSNRLAGLCKQDKQIRHNKHKKQEAPQTSFMTINKLDRTKSTIVNGTSSSSTEALVNETQSSNIIKESQTNFDSNGNLNDSKRTSPRIQLLMRQQQQQQQQRALNKTNSKDNNNNNSSRIEKTINKRQLINDDTLKKPKKNLLKSDHDDIKTRITVPTIYRPTSNSTFNQSDKSSTSTANQLQRPKTALIRDRTLINPIPTQINLSKIKPTHISTVKKKSVGNNHIDSTSTLPKSTIESERSAYSQTYFPNRPTSSNVGHRPVVLRANESVCSIREAKGATSRYNKPEELFGIRPEELFAPEQYQPKILEQRSRKKSDENTRSKRQQHKQQQQHIWQQDVDKIIELYNIHHSANYRQTAKPPTPPSTTQNPVQIETVTELPPTGKVRQTSTVKNSATNLKSTTNSKQSTLSVINLPRQNSITRPSIKLTNT